MKNREIKFRAWDIDKNEMFTPDMSEWCINFDNGYISVLKSNMNFTTQEDCYIPVENFELMQYTGLKDKNGKEIYKGDIVEKRDFITGITQYYQIIWSNGDCGFIGKGKNDSLFNGLGIISKELEIIGNIYENPNLAIK